MAIKQGSAVIIVDSSFAICVASEKVMLVKELIKHYRPRWQTEAAAAEFNTSGKVCAMLEHLQVEHFVLDPVETVDILDAPAESEGTSDQEDPKPTEPKATNRGKKDPEPPAQPKPTQTPETPADNPMVPH